MGPHLAAGLPDPYLGRDDLAALLTRLAGTGRSGGCPRVQLTHVIGNGGTAVAVAFVWSDEWSAEPLFDDGRMYLSATEPATNTPVPAEELQAAVLLQLDYPQDEIPTTPQRIDAVYQRVTRNKKILLVLDNATAATNVAPLLPHSAQSMVIVVAHRTLPLPGFRVVEVPPLSAEAARALLAVLVDRLGGNAAGWDEATVAGLLDVCAGSPAIIHLVAGAIGQDPTYASRLLADVRAHGLEAFRAEGGDGLIRALDLAYDALDPEPARTYRLLSLLPGLEFTAPAAGAVLGVDDDAVQRSLHALVRYNVLRVVNGRYRWYRPVREHAAMAATRDEPVDVRIRALRNGIAWYRQEAVRQLCRASDRWQVRAEQWRMADLVGDASITESRRAAALDFLTVERGNLEAAFSLAVGHDRSAAVDLALALWIPYHRSAPGDAGLDLCERAIEVARTLDDPATLVQLELQYGGLLLAADDLTAARRHLSAGLALTEQLDRERPGSPEWLVEPCQSSTAGRQDARGAAERQGARGAPEWLGAQGRQSGLEWLGKVARRAGDPAEAVRLFDASGAVSVPLAQRDRTRAVLDLQLARAWYDLGRYPAAVAAARAATAFFATTTETDNRAKSAYELGRALLAAGDAAAAVAALRTAAERFAVGGSVGRAARAWSALAAAHRERSDPAAELAALDTARGQYERLYADDEVARIDTRRVELAAG